MYFGFIIYTLKVIIKQIVDNVNVDGGGRRVASDNV